MVLLFPGQGSLRDLASADILKTTYAYELDRKAQAYLGESILKAIQNSSESSFRKTSFAQPVTFFLGLLTYLILKEELDVYFAGASGHSLGELTALTSSGFFDIKTGFFLVGQRARLMEICVRETPSEMVAVIGEHPEALAEISVNYGVFPANFNGSHQVVYGGPIEGIEIFKDEARRLGYRVVPLPVQGAFHTKYMEYAATEFKKVLESQKIGNGAFPVISNVDGMPYSNENLVDKLSRQISSPVLWTECLKCLNNLKPEVWIEVFPGTVLTN